METIEKISTAILASIITNEKKRKILLSLPHYTIEFRVIANYIEHLISINSDVKILICTNTEIPKARIISELSSRGLTDFDVINNHKEEPISKAISIININDYVTSTNLNLLNTKFNAIILIYCQEMGLSDPKVKMRQMMDEVGDTSTIIGIDDDIDKASLFFGEPIYTLSVDQAIRYELLRKYSWKYNHDINVRNSILHLRSDINDVNAVKIVAQSIIEDSKTGKSLVLCDSLELAKSISKFINDEIENRKSIVFERYNSKKLEDFFADRILQIAFMQRNTISIDDSFLDLSNLIILQIEDKQIRDFEKYIFPFLKTKGSLQHKDLTVCEYTLTNIKDVIPTNGLHDSDMKPVIGVNHLAKTLSGIISSLFPSNTAPMIGIFGEWGRGKTFLMNHIKEEINKRNKDNKDEVWRFIKYSAWKYQESSAIGVCLYDLLKKEFKSDQSIKDRIFCAIRKERRFIIVSIVLIVVIFCLFAICKLSITPSIIDVFLFVISIFFLKFFFRGEIISKIVIPNVNITYYRDFLGPNVDIRDSIKNLIIEWKKIHKNKKFRLVIFVDDIDRCDETKLVSTIDSFRTFLDEGETVHSDDRINSDDNKRKADIDTTTGVVVVAALDEKILVQALKNKYDRQKDKDRKNDSLLTKEYIDKIFCLSIKLPLLTDVEKEEFTSAFIDYDYSAHKSQPIQECEIGSIMSKINPSKPNPSYDINKENIYSNKVINSLEESKVLNTKRISEFEREKIIEIISKSTFVRTPRQIRIIYYRYKLIKALLRDIDVDSFNYWFTEQNITTILTLIIEMSYDDNFVSIRECIDKCTQSNNQMLDRLLHSQTDKYVLGIEKVLMMAIPY